MSYGVYSEVYFAICDSSDVLIKIGETTNARRRASQLYREGYSIVHSMGVLGDEAERLFVESFLRARIKASGHARPLRKDYFECDCPDSVWNFRTSFEKWVNEANAVLTQMQSGNGITFQAEFKNGKPIYPEEKREIFEDILESCDTRGYWCNAWQCSGIEEDEFLVELKKILVPYGYTCSSRRNYSWAHFKVEKIFRQITKKGLTTSLFSVIL